mgnify:CR=1 FL=1
MLKIINYSKAYRKDQYAVKNLNLEVEAGDLFAFIGHNGAGKSTTIKSIVGILPFEEGEIYIDGLSVKDYPVECKKKIAYIPDNPDLYESLTGMQYLNFIGDVYGVDQKTRYERISKLANDFGIYNSLKDRIQGYSHGMKQKIVIIGVLLHNPKNWILDEPMTGLDPKASFQLKELMREHSDKGNTVFFSTHVLEVAEKICDKIAVIDKGKIKFVGTCEELREKWKSNLSLIHI